MNNNIENSNELAFLHSYVNLRNIADEHYLTFAAPDQVKIYEVAGGYEIQISKDGLYWMVLPVSSDVIDFFVKRRF